MNSKCYFPPPNDDKRNKALYLAKTRGEAAEEWFKTNTLTKETKPEFDKLMKDVTKKAKTAPPEKG